VRILVLGGVSYDEIIHVDDFIKPESGTYYARDSYSIPGSTGLGKALAFKALGYEVDFIATLGKDEYGKTIEETLGNKGVNFYPIYSDKTERHTNFMNRLGDRISIFTAMPKESVIDVRKYTNLFNKADIICLNIKNYCKQFIPLLEKLDKPIYCDIHDYDGVEEYHKPFIDVSDYIFMSSDKLGSFKPFMKELIKKGKKWVCCTHAEKGATMLRDNKYTDLISSRIEIADTNGAGDNFFAGLLFGLLNDCDESESLKIGRLVAESCIKSKEIVSDKLNLDYLKKI